MSSSTVGSWASWHGSSCRSCAPPCGPAGGQARRVAARWIRPSNASIRLQGANTVNATAHPGGRAGPGRRSRRRRVPRSCHLPLGAAPVRWATPAAASRSAQPRDSSAPMASRSERRVPRRWRRAHQADAPDLAGQGAEAGADLDAVFVEQARAHRGFVDAVGHVDRVELRQAMLLVDQQFQSQRLEPAASAAWLRRWRAQAASRPSSCSITSASCSAYSVLIGAVWW